MISDKEITIRLAFALFAGILLGFERSRANKAAGIRTHALVCIGSTLIMIVSAYGFKEFGGMKNMDPARIAAQVIAGVGFLGAGVIWKEGSGGIRGLTTAANLWVAAAIGLALGLGFYFPVMVTLVCIFVALNITAVLIKLGILEYSAHE